MFKKSFIVLTALAVFVGNSYSSDILHREKGGFISLLDVANIETSFFASKPIEKWNFELANRSKREIRVTLKIGMITILDKVLSGRKLPTQTPKIRASLPQTINVDLIIETLEDGGIKKIVRHFNSGKNIFLNYDNDSVYPQEGINNPLQQMKRTTKSGLPLDNNVTVGEIFIIDQE